MKSRIFVIMFLCCTTIIEQSHQGHYLVETKGSAKRPHIGRAEVKDEETNDSDDDAANEPAKEETDDDAANEPATGETDNASPATGADQPLVSKFEKLLTNITETMKDGKDITDEVYIQWGKSLEEIIEIGNKTIPMEPPVEVTNDDGNEASIVNSDNDGEDDEENKKGELRMLGRRKRRYR